jgi:hypothetical protein
LWSEPGLQFSRITQWRTAGNSVLALIGKRVERVSAMSLANQRRYIAPPKDSRAAGDDGDRPYCRRQICTRWIVLRPHRCASAEVGLALTR